MGLTGAWGITVAMCILNHYLLNAEAFDAMQLRFGTVLFNKGFGVQVLLFNKGFGVQVILFKKGFGVQGNPGVGDPWS